MCSNTFTIYSSSLALLVPIQKSFLTSSVSKSKYPTSAYTMLLVFMSMLR